MADKHRAPDSRGGRLSLAQLFLPVIELRIANPESEDGIRQAFALAPVARMNADKHGAVAAAFDVPAVNVERYQGWSAGQRD
jgi:hypothetical protein